MSSTDVQRFEQDGIWVKPHGAATVDIVVRGGRDGMPVVAHRGESGTLLVSGGVSILAEGLTAANPGETVRQSLAAGDMADECDVKISDGGYVEITTHVAGTAAAQ